MNSMMFIQIIVKLLFIGLKVLLSPFKKLFFFCFIENWETNNYNTHIAQYFKK